MAGRFTDISSSVSLTLTDVAPGTWGYVINTGGGAITITAPASTTFKGGATTYSLPAGKWARFTRFPGGFFSVIQQAP